MAKSFDYSRSKGGIALAARLRRVSERFDRDGTRAYAAHGIAFEQGWYGVLRQIIERGPVTVGEIATAIHVSHVAASKASRSLEKAGYVRSLPSAGDKRRRLIALTDEGERLVERLTPLWDAFNATAAELNEEAGDIIRLLDKLDDALDEQSVFERIRARIGPIDNM